jgi:hypothetical protein
MQGRVGEVAGQDGQIQPIRLGRKGALVTQDAHGRYQEAIMRGNVYFLSIANAGPTAYTGGAAGTPLIGLKNPVNSGKALVLLALSLTIYTSAGTAGLGGFAFYYGSNTAVSTGTKTNPTNALTMLATGSVAYGFVNTAMTGSTALTFLMAVATYYWATAGGAVLQSGFIDLGGIVVVAPSNEVAFGLQVLPASTTVSCTLLWEEIPYP